MGVLQLRLLLLSPRLHRLIKLGIIHLTLRLHPTPHKKRRIQHPRKLLPMPQLRLPIPRITKQKHMKPAKDVITRQLARPAEAILVHVRYIHGHGSTSGAFLAHGYGELLADGEGSAGGDILLLDLLDEFGPGGVGGEVKEDGADSGDGRVDDDFLVDGAVCWVGFGGHFKCDVLPVVK